MKNYLAEENSLEKAHKLHFLFWYQLRYHQLLPVVLQMMEVVRIVLPSVHLLVMNHVPLLLQVLLVLLVILVHQVA